MDLHYVYKGVRENKVEMNVCWKNFHTVYGDNYIDDVVIECYFYFLYQRDVERKWP